MSGIDKLEITLKDDPSKSNLAGYPIKEFIQKGRSLGYLDNWTYREISNTRLLCLQPLATNGPRRGEILAIPRFWKDYDREESKSVQHVEKIITNPRHFENMGVLIETLQALDNADMVIQCCPVTRIDFAADIIEQDKNFPLIFDVGSKRLSECYFEADSGKSETAYWGGKQDVLCIYDRNALMNKVGRDDLLSASTVIRTEHRYKKPKHLAQSLLKQNVLFLDDLQEVGNRIINGTVSPLETVQAGYIEHPPIINLLPEDACRIGAYIQSTKMGGQALARRAFKNDPVMKMIQFTPYPVDNQPAQILRQSMRVYMTA